MWVETRLGVDFSDVDQRWVRARPRTVTQAVEELAHDSGRERSACGAALRDLLLTSSRSERDRTGRREASDSSFFAFKLHQFISGAGQAFATFDPPGERVVTVEGQQFLPGHAEKRLYRVHFCRECGHEYHPVRLTTVSGHLTFLARDIDDAPLSREDDDEGEDGADEAGSDEGGVFGFLTPHGRDARFEFEDRDDQYPETWLDFDAAGNPRLKSNRRKMRAQGLSVASNGRVGGGTRAWFMPGPFRFCLRCGDSLPGAGRDRNRLASLSAEGRSSATTVLVTSALRLNARRRLGPEPFTAQAAPGSPTPGRTPALPGGSTFHDFPGS